MKQTKKVISLLLAVVLCMSTAVIAFAGSRTVLLPKCGGEIQRGKSHYFEFSVPGSCKCFIDFEGYEEFEEYDGTYGGAKLEILDEFDECVHEEDVYTEFDDYTVSVNLSKGDYTLVLTENNHFTFEYVLSISANYYTPVQFVKLNKSSVSLTVKKSTTLTATYEPSYANPSLSWTSSNKKVAVVNSKGQVTAKALGTAKITVMADSKTASCTVNVNKTSQQIFLGESKKLRGLIKNINGYENATWSSSNKNIVVVSKNGKATSKAFGSADITAKIGNAKYSIRVSVPKIKISQKSAELHPGETLQLSMTGTNKDITWKTSNKSVATVSSTGLVKAKSYGTAKITATVDGKKYSCKISVVYQAYGSVKGTVTYYYNRNYGQVADVGAKVYILDPKEKKIVTTGMADGNGNYEITGIPTGEYELIIVSAHATCLQDDETYDYYAEYGVYVLTHQIGYCDITLEEDTEITANHSFSISTF